jgi:NitT/TauT family transport system permease protein
MFQHHRYLFRDFFRASLRRRAWAVVAALVVLALLVSLALRRPPWSLDWTGIDAGHLALAALATMLRLTIAYTLSVSLAILIASLVTSNRYAEQWLMPVFDILQSVPVLAFFPLAVVLFARVGFYEGAAQLVLLTAMLWPILFNLIGAVRTIPRDVQDAARVYGARGLRYWRHVILPAAFPALVTGSMLALGAGWNIVIAAEFINYGGHRITLLGLGSLLDQATQSDPPDNLLFLLALALMIAVIVLTNRLVWHWMLARAERYKFE